jgi:hypothetical protein
VTGHWTEGIEALTLTFLQGAALEEVAATLQFDRSTERLTTFDSAFDGLDVESACYPVQVGELDGWLVVVEPNGFLLADEGVLARLSRAGTAVSYFRNINAHSLFVLAREGRVVRSFDPVIPDEDESEGEPLAEEHDLRFGDDDEDHMASAFTLLERLTGVRIEEEWLLERRRPTWLAPEPPPYQGPPGPPAPPEERPTGGFLRRAFRRR